MKIPNKVRIDGIDWKIKTDPKSDNAKAQYDPHIITIGTESKGRIPENAVHEVLEIILENRSMRYKSWNDPEYRIMFPHKDITSILSELLNVFEFKFKQKT